MTWPVQIVRLGYGLPSLHVYRFVQCFRVSPLLILVAIPRADEHEMRPTRDYCPRLWDVTLKTGILISTVHNITRPLFTAIISNIPDRSLVTKLHEEPEITP
ncbi:Protein of unknown function [Pyronema omphalodes CBS 100304]|uniref:Uncharacterized protein n=1 Tax=Pyronema omphalodes (strain CBS 100304) TaxID=1076935 RepID=U4LPD8_PYROM|nr:Protein of unknown function [Pyronema omphalodes CBS 100304]